MAAHRATYWGGPMKRRLYFVLPDLGSAVKTANDLLLARIEDRQMHFLARRGMSLGELHEANYFQKSDLRHSLLVGLAVGGVAGFLFGVGLYLTRFGGLNLQLVTIPIATVLGAMFGAGSEPDRHLDPEHGAEAFRQRARRGPRPADGRCSRGPCRRDPGAGAQPPPGSERPWHRADNAGVPVARPSTAADRGHAGRARDSPPAIRASSRCIHR